MRPVLVWVLMLLACADSVAGQWRYEESTDKMTGNRSSYATISSDNSLQLSFPYSGANFGSVTVRRHPQYGLDVIVRVDKGQILCRSYDGCSIPVRFDDGKVQRFEGVASADHNSAVVFLTPASRFIAAAKKAKTIFVQLPMYQAGNQVLEFTSPVELVWK